MPDDTPRRYLLRRVSDAEAERFEERILSEDACADGVREAEDDLIDDYARERLSAEDRDAVERHLLRTDDGRARERVARALSSISQQHGDAVGAEGKDDTSRGKRSAWRAGRWVAPVGLLVAASLAFVVLVVSRTSAPQHTSPAADVGQTPLLVEPHDASPTPVQATPYAVLLLADVRRGAGRAERIEIPAGTEQVRLQTEVPDGPSATGGDASYQVAVRSSDGQELFTSEPLAVRQVGAYRIVEAAIPAQRLGDGVRRIELVRRDGGITRTVFEWQVDVRSGAAP